MTHARSPAARTAARAARRAPRATPRPSKTAAGENFPVGSWLIARAHRPHVAAYYRFARSADDVADHPTMNAAEKLARLNRMEIALRTGGGETEAAALGALLARRGIDLAVATDLLAAFRRDASNDTCATVGDLEDYCRHSAVPVGRFLLALHGERAGISQADALCTALQILNHVQDCRGDYLRLNRVYVPLDWLAEARLDAAALGGSRATPSLRGVLDRMLDHAGCHLATANTLPRQLKDGGLRRESAVMLALARRLSDRLRRTDPLAEDVRLSLWDWTAGVLRGITSP